MARWPRGYEDGGGRISMREDLSPSRQRLHELIDELPDAQVQAVLAFTQLLKVNPISRAISLHLRMMNPSRTPSGMRSNKPAGNLVSVSNFLPCEED